MEKTSKIPEKERAFFEELGKVFKKYPGMNQKYTIDARHLFSKLEALKKDDERIVKKWDGNRIVVELVKGSSGVKTDGCCRWCVDDDGNTYCCESGDDCP